MTGYQIISDLQRVVRLDEESARPNRPIRLESARQRRQSIFVSTRLGMTVALRRLADVVEPARAHLDSPASVERQPT